MSFTDMPRDAPATGTGKAAAEALVTISRALFGAMNPPLHHGYIADGHVAIALKGGY